MIAFLRIVFILAVSAIAVYESVLGLLQAFGLITSQHILFVMTGTFDNPGPYGGAIAVLLSVLVSFLVISRDDKKGLFMIGRLVSTGAAMLCVIVLPASMSRAAWLGVCLVCLVLAFNEYDLRKWIAANRMMSVLAAVIFLGLLTGVFFIKIDSAIGRLHIWHMELRAICDSPWSGTGSGTVLGTYGRVQAEYFAEKERCETIVRVAGCPEYAFNEYLRIGVEYGLPAMLAVIISITLLICFLIRKRTSIGYGLLALSIFSFFSYPISAFHVATDAEREWKSLRHQAAYGIYDETLHKYESLYSKINDNYSFLYDYGYALHKQKQYARSNEILEEGSRISSDPMFYNIMGRNHEALGDFKKAEECYLHAHYMVPSRLYPLVLLMEMYAKNNQESMALYYGYEALGMYVNPIVPAMKRLRDRVLSCVDTLSTPSPLAAGAE